MQFTVRKRRTAPAVIIISLIDVLIVVLIFLMVTTTFKQQPAVKLELPESSQSKQSGASENVPLVVSIDAKGMYYLDKFPKTFEQLTSELRAGVAKNPQLILAINADENAPWGKVVKVRDAASDAKIKTLIAYTKEAGKR